MRHNQSRLRRGWRIYVLYYYAAAPTAPGRRRTRVRLGWQKEEEEQQQTLPVLATETVHLLPTTHRYVLQKQLIFNCSSPRISKTMHAVTHTYATNHIFFFFFFFCIIRTRNQNGNYADLINKFHTLHTRTFNSLRTLGRRVCVCVR